jgi:hypothetical protein
VLALQKLYVNEIDPDGEISTVGLFYSRAEAERVVARLRSLPEKRECRYEIAGAVPGPSRSRGERIKQT